MRLREPKTTSSTSTDRTVIPGLNDKHTHLNPAAALNYNLELRWDGVASLADASECCASRRAAPRHPSGWVVALERVPSSGRAADADPGEINAAAPDTPVFGAACLRREMLNAAALRAVGYAKDTPDPAGGEDRSRRAWQPTGMLIAGRARRFCTGRWPKGQSCPLDFQLNSTRHFMRELTGSASPA